VSAGTWTWLTPPEPAALAVLRCSALPGLAARALPATGQAGFARLRDRAGAAVDEVVLVRVADDALEITTHGGPGVRAAVGACLAGHGLVEVPWTAGGALVGDAAGGGAVAWSDLARAASPAAVRWLLAHPRAVPPFPAGLLTRAPVVLITGPANAGKSTLLNAWCGRQRALVSDIPGTTRDLVAAHALVGGWRLRLVDSAGLRPTADPLEQAGQDLVAAARGWADLVLYLQPPDGSDGCQPGDLVVQGKADLREPVDKLCWSAKGKGGTGPAELLTRVGAAVLTRLGLPSA
jgi:hypothetical protein